MKTKWIITTDTVTLFPNRLLNIFGLVLAIGVIGLGIYTKAELVNNSQTFVNYLLIFGMIPVLFFLQARTKIVFSLSDHKMYVKLFGFLNTKTVDFSNIAAIQQVNQNGASFNFQVFTTENRHGKGTRISSGYSKDTDKNVVALVDEVFPVLDNWLATVPLVNDVPQPLITSFKYYELDQGIYTLKVKGGFLMLMGLLLFGVGIFLFVKPGDSGSVFANLLCIVLGLFLMVASTRRTKFDTNTRMIHTGMIGGLRHKEYPFNAAAGFDIIRKTTNFIYSGTDVGLKLDVGKPDRLDVITLRSFLTTGPIDLFIRETETILKA